MKVSFAVTLLDWLLGKNALISPLLLMLFSAVAAGVVFFVLHRRPLTEAQDELRGSSPRKEYQVILSFFTRRRGLWWQAVVVWLALSFLSIALVQVLK